MNARMRSFLFSFQTKLVVSLTLVIALAILLSGAIFVARTRDERRQQALDRVAAASPAIYQQAFLALLPQQQSERPFSETLDALAVDQDVRILLVSSEGLVLHDTAGKLSGTQIEVPRSSIDDVRRGFVAWQPAGQSPDAGSLTFVAASQRFVTGGGRELPFRIVLAVESDTIAGAWLGLLPSLTLAGLIAIPLAMLAAIVLARQVAQPVRKLTAASEAMARGDFDQRIEVSRDDEVGRLARSFTAMAEHVGTRDTQMRDLLANVSHDLKTPMTSITGYAQALTDGTAEAADTQHIGRVINDEATHVNALLADLLYLGEIDAGQVITKREDVSLDAIVGRCVRRIEPAAKAKALDINVDLASDAVLHDVDADKLERAFTNVLENAAKFTPAGGEITVIGRRENGVGPSHVVCTIANTGTSIPDEDLGRVFDRFFRGDRARRTASGSGLGLAITRELVELNRGTIEATNEPGGGVSFRVVLPA